MTKLLITLFSCLLISVLSFSQVNYNNKPTAVVKIDPALLALWTLSTKYEYILNDNFSLQIGGTITNQNVTYWGGLGGRVFGYSTDLQLRYFINPDQRVGERLAPLGFYTGVWGQYETFSANITIGGDTGELLSGGAIKTGVILGYQFWLKIRGKKIMLIDPFLGGGYKFADYSGKFTEKGRLIAFTRKGITGRIGVSVGIGI